MSAPETALELARRALGHAEGDALVTVTHERSLTARFARSAPTQATEIDARTISVLSVVDGHTGSATVTDPDDDVLRGAARRARAAAQAAAWTGPGVYPGLPEPATPRPHEGFDLATARVDASAAGDALATVFAVVARHGLEAHGAWTAGVVEHAIASSTGTAVVDRVTDAHLKVHALDGLEGRSGYAAATASATARIDPAAVAEQAAAKVARDAEPARIDPGAYPVVLDAPAVGELLSWLGWLGFDGLAHAEGRGALTDRLGTRVAASRINLSDSPRFARTLPRAFDAEGVAKAPLPLIQDGVAHRVVHDTRSAAIAGGGAVSTGHALAAGGSPYGAAPTNLVLIGGDAVDIDELAAPIERGLYVTRLWYVNAVHERTATVTGVTRDGTFLVEDGKITRPLRDVRFTDSILRILDATEALTAASRLVSEAEFYGPRFATGVVCPALRAHGFQVTGGA